MLMGAQLGMKVSCIFKIKKRHGESPPGHVRYAKKAK